MKKIIFVIIFGIASICKADTSDDHTSKAALLFCRAYSQLIAALKIEKIKFKNTQAKACAKKALVLAEEGFEENNKALKALQEEKQLWKEMLEKLSK